MHAVRHIVFLALLLLPASAQAETPEEWVALGARIHGAFGSFIPLGIKIGLDAVDRLKAKPRELAVLYYDSAASPCACFADGVAIATYSSVGQRTLVVAADKAPRRRIGGRRHSTPAGRSGFQIHHPGFRAAQVGSYECETRSAWPVGCGHERQ